MPALFLEDTSPKPLVPTTEAFREAVKSAGWSVLGVTNMAGILSERGFTPHPVLVFVACSGKYGADLLSKDEHRFVSSTIPCRVAIYQTSTGKVVISRMNSVAMSDMVGWSRWHGHQEVRRGDGADHPGHAEETRLVNRHSAGRSRGAASDLAPNATPGCWRPSATAQRARTLRFLRPVD